MKDFPFLTLDDIDATWFLWFPQGRVRWIVPFHSSSQRHLGIGWANRAMEAWIILRNFQHIPKGTYPRPSTNTLWFGIPESFGGERGWGYAKQGYVGILLETSVYCWSWETNCWHLDFDPLASQRSLHYLYVGGDQTLRICVKIWWISPEISASSLGWFHIFLASFYDKSDFQTTVWACWRATTSASLLNAAMV